MPRPRGLETADGQVELRFIEQTMHLVAPHRSAQQPDARGLPTQPRGEIGHDEHLHLAGKAQPEGALLRASIEVVLSAQGLLHLAKGVADAGGQRAGAGGGPHDLAGAHEERVTQQHPQQGQVVAHGGLLHPQPRGRPGDAALFHQRVEGHEQVQVEAA